MVEGARLSRESTPGAGEPAALSLATALALLAPAFAYKPGPATYSEGLRANLAIPMRDGVTLRADIHYPANPDGSAATYRTVAPAHQGGEVPGRQTR